MFEWITAIIRRLGYTGVAILTLLENVFPPIPSELVIPLAGYVAAQGDLRLWLVIVMGTTGSLAGAWLWYELGRRIGEARLRAWVEAGAAIYVCGSLEGMAEGVDAVLREQLGEPVLLQLQKDGRYRRDVY